VAPRYAKMLCLARKHGCLAFVTAIVAALTVKVPLAHVSRCVTHRTCLCSMLAPKPHLTTLTTMFSAAVTSPKLDSSGRWRAFRFVID
jgi:HrpA-like RNA helicase